MGELFLATQMLPQPPIHSLYPDAAISRREVKVLQQMAGGNRNKDIADLRFQERLSERTRIAQELYVAAAGQVENFSLVVEGSIPNENNKSEGYWTHRPGSRRQTVNPLVGRERNGLCRLTFGVQGIPPRTMSSILGCVAAVIAMVSPSHPSPAVIQSTSISAIGGECGFQTSTCGLGKSRVCSKACPLDVNPRLSFRVVVPIRIKSKRGTRSSDYRLGFTGVGNEDHRHETGNVCRDCRELGLATGIDDTGYTSLFAHKVYVMPTFSPDRD